MLQEKGGKTMQPQLINIPHEKLIPNSQIVQGRLIGKGGYGYVYEANWNGERVAVKRLMLEKMNQKTLQEFEKEINLHLKLSHPRVIRLYGIIAEAGAAYAMVMVYAAKGSLFSLLDSTKQSEFSWDKRKVIAMDAITGLQYLHQIGIIHRDLKSLNVLIDEYDRAQLADFGLSKVRTETESQSKFQVEGTIQFLAPELLHGFGAEYDCKTDIYAYGMMLWELATHEIPYGNTKATLVRDFVKEGQREKFPDEANIPREYQDLTKLCWAQKPEDRPTVEIIQELLNQMEFGKSNPHTSMPSLYSSVVNNSGYALQSDVQPLQNSNGSALKTETVTLQIKKQGQGYVLEFKTGGSQNVQKNDIEAIYKLAHQYIKQSKYSKAVPLLEELAEKQGHADAQYDLGLFYSNGRGVIQDDNKAMKYFRSSANNGNADAQYFVGGCYFSGQRVPQSAAEGVKYYLLAANQEHSDALFGLGVCYYNGLGVKKDKKKAKEYYQLAADQKHSKAIAALRKINKKWF